MQTLTLPYDDMAIAEGVRLLSSGYCVAVPTETVYGLAADATDPAAVTGIFVAKGRPTFNPLIVHVADIEQAEEIAIFDDEARRLADRFWPGPLTLVLPVRPGAVAPMVTARLDTVAIRVPAHRAMASLLNAYGKPLAAPSANASNRISPTRAEHVLATLGGRIRLVIDDGPTSSGLESTIVRGRTVLRPGPITEAELTACLDGDMLRSVVARIIPKTRVGVDKSRVTSPGQLPVHYAPAKSLRLGAAKAARDEWLIGFGPVTGDDTLSATGDVVEAGASLFDALYRADASDRARIAIAPIPEEGVGAAINDRLRRAAQR